jgi:hypothetical protein
MNCFVVTLQIRFAGKRGTTIQTLGSFSFMNCFNMSFHINVLTEKGMANGTLGFARIASYVRRGRRQRVHINIDCRLGYVKGQINPGFQWGNSGMG